MKDTDKEKWWKSSYLRKLKEIYREAGAVRNHHVHEDVAAHVEGAGSKEVFESMIH
jgi:hypothetical protein